MMLFRKKYFVNVLADAGTVLRFKCVHAMISHPGVDESLLIDVYENHGFKAQDYKFFFQDIFQQVISENIAISSVIIDQLPAQISGVSNLIEESNDRLIKSIIVVPCFCHLTSLMFTSAIHANKNLKKMVDEIQDFVNLLRKTAISNCIGHLCPQFKLTRWLYVIECLRFIFRYIDDICIARINGYMISEINTDFFKLYDILLPIKVLNLLGERVESRLCFFVQHIQNAILDFQSLYAKYLNDRVG